MEKQNAKIILAHDGVLARPDAKKLLARSEEMMGKSIAFGFKRFMLMGAALHNIRSLGLFTLNVNTPTWEEYISFIGIGATTAERYLSIGGSVHARLIDDGKLKDGEAIQMSDVLSLVDANVEKLKDFSLVKLVALSNKVDIFDPSMGGPALLRLLPGRNEDAQAKEKIVARSEAEEWHRSYEKTAEAYGFVWNRKKFDFEHEDGTPLTDEEYGMVTHPDLALRVFELAKREGDRILLSARETIHSEMKNFLRYTKASKNQRLERKAFEIRTELQEKFQTVIHMLDALMEGDEARVKEIYKHGLES